MKNNTIATESEWIRQRKILLKKEKAFSRLREKLAEERRKLPWVRVEKNYIFEGPAKIQSLSDLFNGKSQLVVYHFMFAKGWKQGCPHCSFWADHYDGMIPHLAARDTSFVVISRAPQIEIKPFKNRMRWKFDWFSCAKNDFNYDFHASFRPEEIKRGHVFYNYEKISMGNMTDREGISVFYKDKRNNIYHTYSTFARGIDMVNPTYQFLDLVPKGRDEGKGKQHWVRYHDRYKK